MAEFLDDAVAVPASSATHQMDAGRSRVPVGKLLPGVGRLSRGSFAALCSALRLRELRGCCRGM